MSERFYSPHPITAGCMMLDGPEAHHLLHVMRASVGDEVTLFDDSGAEFKATVETLRRADAELRIIERREIDRELPFELVVGVALPKGDRQKWLVEKLTELGVTALVPLITESQTWSNWVASGWLGSSVSEPPAVRLLAHPGGQPFNELGLAKHSPVNI